MHDAYLSAAYILSKLKAVEGQAQGMSYWTYIDLFEEPGPPTAPFQGGFGLLTRQGIRSRRTCALALNQELARLVAQKLAMQWSPQQIAGWLRREHPDTEHMQVSHETIYRSLFVQARGVLKKDLMAHLRPRRSMRRARAGLGKESPRGQIIDAVSIRERPAQVEDRAVPGHWEGDLVTGAKNSHIATLVERHSRFALLVQVDGKDTASVVQALTREVKRLPEGLMK